MTGRPRGRLAGWVGRWSVRRRLLLTCLAVLAVGLVVSSVSALVGLRVWLQDRLDEQLVAAQALVAQEVAESGIADITVEVPPAAVRTAYTIEKVEPSGEVTSVIRGTQDPLPDRATLTSLLPPLDTVPDDEPVTVEAGGGAYRVLVGDSPDGGYLVVGGSMEGVDAPVRRLVLITLVTGVTLLALLAVVAWWLLGRGLRPVDRIATAAAAIADGDLSRRVPTLPPSTEIGRLARDLNTMLSQIEAGVAEREQSRLRLQEFVADASHELRTPVTAIRAYLELHERGAIGDDDLPGVLTRVRHETERIGRLVDDLLHLARLDEPRDATRGPVDLSVVASDCVREARAIDADRPVALRAAPRADGAADGRREGATDGCWDGAGVAAGGGAGGDPRGGGTVVAGDEGQLRQVLSNLLSNARVHTPPATSVTVTVAPDGGDVVLAVADDGPGMAGEHARRAFDRFYRADGGRGRSTGGSGLGLAIVERIVANHGGTVVLDSAPDHGTVVTVRLPRAVTSDSHLEPTDA